MLTEAKIFGKFIRLTNSSEAVFRNSDGRYSEEAAFKKSLEGSAIHTK